MEIGLLWFDDSPARSLEEKVQAALAAFSGKERFRGQKADTCCVHPSLLPDGKNGRLDGVRLVGAPYVHPHHFLVGAGRRGGSE